MRKIRKISLNGNFVTLSAESMRQIMGAESKSVNCYQFTDGSCANIKGGSSCTHETGREGKCGATSMGSWYLPCTCVVS